LRVGSLRKEFGPKKGNLAGGWRKLHRLMGSFVTITKCHSVIKTRKTSWTGHVAHM